MSRVEPATVTALRGQIARGATDSLLHRIAGSAAEFNRLASLYGLAATADPAARPAAPLPSRPPPAPAHPDRRSDDPLPQRQATLLGMLFLLAQSDKVFPGAPALAVALDCSWLVVERDLFLLQRKRLIRITSHHDTQLRELKRIAIVGTPLQTALPSAALGLVPAAANAVRPALRSSEGGGA